MRTEMHNLRGVEQHWERGKLWCGGGSGGGGGGGWIVDHLLLSTWDIFYMIEPSAWDWTHMTTFSELGWMQMCIFLARIMCKISISAVPPVLSSLCPHTNKLFQTNRQLMDRDWGFNEKKTDRSGNETLVAHTNCCNNHICIKAL